jgi:hypothetical protein
MDPQAVLQAGSMLHDLGVAVHYDLVRRPDAPLRFVGRAANARVRAGEAAAFREFLEREGQGLLERADAWLAAREVPRDAPRRQRTLRLGVGVFQIEDEAG